MITTNPLPPGERKLGSVGRVCAQAEIAIGGIAGAALPPGTPGEVLVRGPSVISHYGFAATPDSENFIDGWLRTGDVGHVDTEGYLFITGRTKELI